MRLWEIAKSEREIYVFRLSAIRAAPYGLVLQKTTRQLVFEDIHEGLQSEIVFEDNEAACAALAKETANVDVALVLPWRSRSIVARHDLSIWKGRFPPMGSTRRTLRPEAEGRQLRSQAEGNFAELRIFVEGASVKRTRAPSPSPGLFSPPLAVPRRVY